MGAAGRPSFHGFAPWGRTTRRVKTPPTAVGSSSATRLLHRMAQTFRDAPLPHDATTMHLRPDHKLRSAQQEKRIAMGHKEDDHEEQTQGWGSMTMGM